MKKTAKFFTVTIATLTLAVSAATAAGCKINNGNTSDAPYYDTATVYAQAVELGYNGTLEEFIEMISGKDGTDGKDGVNGTDGVGVKSGRIDEHNHLILTLTNDSQIDCGEIILPAHEHSFSEWFLIKETDCTAAGLQLRTCECGHTESKIIPAYGHGDLEWEITDTAHTQICGICKTEIKSGAHVFVDGVCECGFNESQTLAIPVEYTNISQKFEFRHNPTTNAYESHVGIDFDAPVGTDVVASLGGAVESIKVDELSGTTITVAHSNGLKTVYKYVNAREGLQVGDNVARGEVIATVAEPSGLEALQAPHLHFEVINNGVQVDPADYLGLSEQ